MSNFLKFYNDNNISPVSQNIEDYARHIHRRTGLYRTLGIPTLMFKGKDVLEVAPGSGHNSLVTACLGAKSYDLVEPNVTGFNTLVKLFSERKVASTGVSFFNSTLENYTEKRDYDIVLCEGLLPGLNDGDAFFKLLMERVRPGGILVVTCLDNVSCFYETLRRYLARMITSTMDNAQLANNSEKCKYLATYFRPHLGTLAGMTRPVEDWVYDTLLNPAASSVWKNQFSIEKCLRLAEDEFWFYGDSPRMLRHLGWYKNIESGPKLYNETVIQSYQGSLHNLLHYKEESKVSDTKINAEIKSLCEEFTATVDSINIENPGHFSSERIKSDIAPIIKLQKVLDNTDMMKSQKAIKEFLQILEHAPHISKENLIDARELAGAFGRGQQYIAITRNE